jgi:predicted small metal-binding protein
VTTLAMTKSISCADVGADCNWSTSAETEEELMKKVSIHAKEDHPGLEITPELISKIKSHIKET